MQLFKGTIISENPRIASVLFNYGLEFRQSDVDNTIVRVIPKHNIVMKLPP